MIGSTEQQEYQEKELFISLTWPTPLETKKNVISNRKRELDLHFCKINELPLLLINTM
jgi:hypothetical protein